MTCWLPVYPSFNDQLKINPFHCISIVSSFSLKIFSLPNHLKHGFCYVSWLPRSLCCSLYAPLSLESSSVLFFTIFCWAFTCSLFQVALLLVIVQDLDAPSSLPADLDALLPCHYPLFTTIQGLPSLCYWARNVHFSEHY